MSVADKFENLDTFVHVRLFFVLVPQNRHGLTFVVSASGAWLFPAVIEPQETTREETVTLAQIDNAIVLGTGHITTEPAPEESNEETAEGHV